MLRTCAHPTPHEETNAILLLRLINSSSSRHAKAIAQPWTPDQRAWMQSKERQT